MSAAAKPDRPERDAYGNILSYDANGNGYVTADTAKREAPETSAEARAALERAKARLAEHEDAATQANASCRRVAQTRAEQLTPADMFEDWRSTRLSQEAQERAASVRGDLKSLEARVRAADNRSFAQSELEQKELQRRYVAVEGGHSVTNFASPWGGPVAKKEG